MDYMICANCYWRDSFTGFCGFRNSSPTPFYWCPAWYDSIWISMLFSIEDEDGDYKKFLEELMETP